VNLTVDAMSRIADALGQRLELLVHPPKFVSNLHSHDIVHAWCSGYVTRRLLSAGWLVEREVEVSDRFARGWIDILALQPVAATLVIIEIKTRLDDFGAMERQLGWYERHSAAAAARLRWRPASTTAWLLGLASDEVDEAVRRNRDAVQLSFTGRADEILRSAGGTPASVRRAIALIDPASRRRNWLIRTRLDGRRSALPYHDYANAAGRMMPRAAPRRPQR